MCGITFKRSRKSKGLYCSPKCFGISQRTLKEIRCPVCKKEFRQKAAVQKYCGSSCAAKVNNTRQGTCATCSLPNSVKCGRINCDDCILLNKISAELNKSDAHVRGQPKRPKQPNEILGIKSDALGKQILKWDIYNKWVSGKHTGHSNGTTEGLLSATLRKRIMEVANWTCQSPDCDVPGGFKTVHKITGLVPLEIDHINGDSYDNRPTNIAVLCPNCHALTPTFRSLNKNSRRKRT